jgi:membrane-bound metal-dependent hydrolase YbcI (DUF457 family)
MDLFTHLMFGFLLSSRESGGFYNIYVIFGCFAAILPDIDIFFLPLWKRYPLLRHHGITHTLLFALAAPVFVWVAYSGVSGSSDAKLLVVMWTGSLSHVLSDFITNWGVPLLYPVSKEHYKLNIDTAVNPIMMLFFVIVAATWQLGTTKDYSYLNVWNTSTIVGLIYIAYFAMRTGIKLGMKLPGRNRGFGAVPTMNPFRWRLARRAETKGVIIVTVREKGKDTKYRIPKKKVKRIGDDEDIVPYTYYHPEIYPWMAMYRYPYYKIRKSGKTIEISWTAVELPFHLTGAKWDGEKLVIDSYWGPSRRSGDAE